MQKLQSDLKRSEDQLKSKDQEIGRLKRKVQFYSAILFQIVNSLF